MAFDPFKTIEAEPKTPIEPQLQPVAAAFGQLSDVLKETFGIMLGAEIEVSKPNLGILPAKDVISAVGQGIVVAHTTYSKGVDGSIFILAKTNVAVSIVGLILGVSPEEQADDLDEDAMDAYLELVGQVCGKVNLSFSELYGKTVSTNPFAAFSGEADDAKKLFGEGDLLCAELGLSSGEALDGAFMFIMPTGVADQLGAAGGQSIDDIIAQAAESAEAEEAPAPPPIDAVAAPMPNGMDERLQVIMDMDLPIHVRFGETQMLIRDVLQLGPGSIIELNKSVDTPVDLVVNNKLVIARGEVVVVESNFAIRITEIKSKTERIKSLS
ncbi:flagellar motor switch protein FliN [bacterium]|nr:flagellar motor switch protein FliN [bacterium]